MKNDKQEVFFVFNSNNGMYIGQDNKPTEDLHEVKYMSEEEAVSMAHDLGIVWGVGSCSISKPLVD